MTFEKWFEKIQKRVKNISPIDKAMLENAYNEGHREGFDEGYCTRGNTKNKRSRR